MTDGAERVVAGMVAGGVGLLGLGALGAAVVLLSRRRRG